MGDRPSIDVVVPVYNEEHVLTDSVERLHGYLERELPFAWRIVIADNGSTDGTLAVAERLATRYRCVDVLAIASKGRGGAIRAAWMASDADVVVYTDADLSTGLTGLLPLVAPLVSGHSDLAIGSRLSTGSVVARGPKREIISRSYNMLLRLLFAVRFRDAQCGFKAMRTSIGRRLLPAVQDDAWFFDTELLLLAEHNGLRIHEVPVDWVDDPDSTVDMRATALADLRGVRRVLWTFMRGGGSVELGGLERKVLVDDYGRQAVSFGLIGLASTLLSLALFLVLRDEVGALWANFIGYTATTVGNNWANRRWTFRRRGTADRRWHVAGIFAVYVATVAVSTIALSIVDGNLGAEVLTLIVTWGVAGVIRFSVLRGWVFRRTVPRAG